uniref:rRNA adenine N(6)-methyltransferase n=1 Tax=Pseudo-nitzschia australis TaxID=44445 RepID=A0A7S4ACG0_9STRA|mmetsp:Transcript_17158/g.37530  ORF Transcript_17158/g.37530 Transcript_17158/m.37530 type:complete len:427 (-) Transcript_17158:847-2127(-)|eukprot:CAMPEP_0168170284 /NCGR_PEP_ID=MMETSP0139_2-20121125/4095_1 /TAXON_ID=44445 /ORGANISM="Pseudo-nitzschia australis, Strain 10249 10 AB" /LENGTH=426 /DNA_ID=CAMNT_0008087771 /DNA_START=131 /DNA_END=1411 /DNA_ORIENTATION=+
MSIPKNFSSCLISTLIIVGVSIQYVFPFPLVHQSIAKTSTTSRTARYGWVQLSDGEWEWEEDDPNFVPPPAVEIPVVATASSIEATATPQLPSGKLKPKQSLGQNFLRDGNTVAKMIKAFHEDATQRGDRSGKPLTSIVELGPGAGALTDRLVEKYGTDVLQCIEVDPRAIEILAERYPSLVVHHQDVLQVSYPEMAEEQGEPLVVFGNLPYYITSQILFALADASHYGAVDCATVTMQWEVGQRMVAPTSCKDYGILSVVFQTYADVRCHFKIPPTVFYPQPKVDSALLGLHFLGPAKLRQRLAGVRPRDFRMVVTTAFRQRRKTIRNTLKKLPGIEKEILMEMIDSPPLPLPDTVVAAREQGDKFALAQELPADWMKKRPEELTPGQFVEVTRLMYGDTIGEEGGNESGDELGRKVWRKLKHGT